ncbi:NAD(P)/FAD-dependent oxidoreductase [Devosia sp.]|uniref:NAD(P)/FAD-dependent oxidoreductase n=1 Tax=Devosia sp. TaxID=1871048 RepID=UPI003A94FA30
MHDAIVIGGSFAGLAAATYIARARRDVLVLDTGAPRNRFAEKSHGFLTRDDQPPGDLLEIARTQLIRYPTARIESGQAVSAKAAAEGFTVTLSDGETRAARRLVLAYGVSDQLPDIPGLAERWGRTVIPCPYCHGYEFAGQRLGVLRLGEHSGHQAQLIPEWGPTTYFLNGGAAPDSELRAELDRRGVDIEPRRIARLAGEGTALSEVIFADGSSRALDALYIGPPARANSDIATQLGCAHEETFWGKLITTDALQATSVPGVFAAGDIARAGHSVTFAAADGVMAGTALHRSLVFVG